MAVATLLGSHGGLYTGVFAPDGEHVLRLGLDLPLQKNLTGETTSMTQANHWVTGNKAFRANS